MGYHRAFPDATIIGVDNVPQPNFPFEFVQADANAFPLDGFDLVHGSPPCHDHSTVSATGHKLNGTTHGTGWMLSHTAERFAELDVPWVIENVQGAKMPGAPCEFRLCGSSFGMDIRRHRKFISNVKIDAPRCDHAWQTPRLRSLRNNLRKEGKLSPVVGVHGNAQFVGDRDLRERAMEIDWMSLAELNQSIPPKFTEWIGKQIEMAV